MNPPISPCDIRIESPDNLEMQKMRLYVDRMMAFVERHPNATPMEYERHAQKVAEELGL